MEAAPSSGRIMARLHRRRTNRSTTGWRRSSSRVEREAILCKAGLGRAVLPRGEAAEKPPATIEPSEHDGLSQTEMQRLSGGMHPPEQYRRLQLMAKNACQYVSRAALGRGRDHPAFAIAAQDRARLAYIKYGHSAWGGRKIEPARPGEIGFRDVASGKVAE